MKSFVWLAVNSSLFGIAVAIVSRMADSFIGASVGGCIVGFGWGALALACKAVSVSGESPTD